MAAGSTRIASEGDGRPQRAAEEQSSKRENVIPRGQKQDVPVRRRVQLLNHFRRQMAPQRAQIVDSLSIGPKSQPRNIDSPSEYR